MTTPPPLERSRAAWSAGLSPVMRSAETQATKSTADAVASSQGRRASRRARFGTDGDIEVGMRGGNRGIAEREAKTSGYNAPRARKGMLWRVGSVGSVDQ